MAATEDTEPLKRAAGRPRKTATAAGEHKPKHAAPDPEPTDSRIGESVNSAAEFISFPDNSEYRCKDGKIVERVR